ncbi:cation diffusion facilitator family transporter [Virgibacillus siamensis]|uniref:cation diffusion facilitator family transporter n=1 Tax=Virgibacillus siamensis TaxID=480071 RepID=UPI000987CAEC|nr:cation diffusion facilitator family transporter [Virgibacillus siamensis]
MKAFFELLKKGSTSSLWASIINVVVAILKGIVFFITGNVAMFAELMHSIGDAVNQLFVFLGSALSNKAPTDRFPGGFARLVNLVLLFAVIIVGVLAYETIKKGIHHIIAPPESGEWVWLNVAVLAAAMILEGFVWFKAMKEITAELTGDDIKGFKVISESFKNISEAKPATKLVFLEDAVATTGALIAIIAILIGTYTPFHSAEGYASVIIGLMLFVVVGRIFLDNAAGVLGASDEDMEAKIGEYVFAEPEIEDIRELMVMREGSELHVELKIELESDMTIAEADKIRDKIENKILDEKGVTDVIIEFDENDNKQHWDESKKETKKVEKGSADSQDQK